MTEEVSQPVEREVIDIQTLRQIVMIQKKENHRLALEKNETERKLMKAAEQVDSLASALIAMVVKFGVNNQVKLTHDELCAVMPGTIIDDKNQDNEGIVYRVITLEDFKREKEEELNKPSKDEVEEKENADI